LRHRRRAARSSKAALITVDNLPDHPEPETDMAGVIDDVDQRTKLVGRNRLELLLFRLSTRQRFGINVFKVREVIRCPRLTSLPRAHRVVRGIAHLRGTTITVMDLAMAIGQQPVGDYREASVILTEFNRTVQGFLVGGVERIVNMNWEEVLPPPKGTGGQNYMTAVTKVDGQLVEIIDVEKVLSEVTGAVLEVNDDIVSSHAADAGLPQRVLVADDSAVARKQITRTLDQLGIEHITANNGREALDILVELGRSGGAPVAEQIGMVISDIEMPEMDGYTLTKEIKDDPGLQKLYVLLHTSLSGGFNEAMVKKVGADEFVRKFNADELAQAVSKRLSGGRGPVQDVA
jgi:two-component system chemotaxis response regulator CheV